MASTLLTRAPLVTNFGKTSGTKLLQAALCKQPAAKAESSPEQPWVLQPIWTPQTHTRPQDWRKTFLPL